MSGLERAMLYVGIRNEHMIGLFTLCAVFISVYLPQKSKAGFLLGKNSKQLKTFVEKGWKLKISNK